MTQKDEKNKLSRRAFLQGSVATGASVAIAASVPGVAVSSTSEDVDDSKKNEGYHLTQHIVDYYKSTAS